MLLADTVYPVKPSLPGHFSNPSTPLSSNKRAQLKLEHSDPSKSTQKNAPKKVPENVKTIRSNYYPSTELQKQRTKDSMAKYDRNETLLGDKILKKSKSEEISARDKHERRISKKAPVPIIRKGLKTGVLDLLGGNDSFLSSRSHTHSHRYSVSKDREDEREENNDDNDNYNANGENDQDNENDDEDDIVEDEGSVRERERERERDRRLLGLYKSNYEGGFRPLNLGPKPVTHASTAAHPDSTYNSDLDDYGAEVWGVRAVVRPNTARALNPDRMHVQGTNGANDPYSASYDIMGRQVAEDEEEGEEDASVSSNQGEGMESRFKSRAEIGTGMGMRYMSTGRGDREEKEGIAPEEGSRSREVGNRREGDEREREGEGGSTFERSFSEPDRTSGDWKMRRVQEWIHSELPLEGEREEEVERERERELEGRRKGIITSSSERVRQSPLRRSSTSSTYSASPVRLEGVGHIDRRNYNAEEEGEEGGEGEGEGEGRQEGGAGRLLEGFGGSEEKRERVPGHKERENEETRAYDDSALHFHESKAKSVFSSVTITGEISPRQNEIRRNEYGNANDKNERQALLSTMERNFWVQDPLLQQQLGLLNDKKNILDRLNISDGNPYKEVEKEGVRGDGDPLLGEKFAHLPLSLPRSFPSSNSSASPADNIQFSLLSARADIHGIIGNSVNYHSGSLIGE